MGSGTPCLSGLLLVRLALDHEPVMGATAKGGSRAREERMEEEIFFLILFLYLCKLHPGRGSGSILPGMSCLSREIPSILSPLDVLRPQPDA